MRVPVVIFSLMGLAACATGAPDSSSGPGFTDYNTYLDERVAATTTPAPYAAAPTTGFSTDVISGAIDAAEGGAAPLNGAATGVSTAAIIPDPLPGATTPGARPRGDAPTTIQTESGEVQNYVTNGVSDENDFAAVAARETIESDAARIEANRAQYVVIQPGSLPTRPGDVGPNIVEFAIATNNPVGVELYDRGGIALSSSERACLKYTSPDQAQQAFLANGGPQSDRKNLDPDGDGFACGWDPTVFRIAVQ